MYGFDVFVFYHASYAIISECLLLLYTFMSKSILNNKISMNSHGYIIMNIHDASHNKYGEVLQVKANPIQHNEFSTYFTPYEYEETELFFVPQTQRFIDSLVSTANAQQPWMPRSKDYFEETVNYGGIRRHSFVHFELLE